MKRDRPPHTPRSVTMVYIALYALGFGITGIWLSARVRFRIEAGELPKESNTDQCDAYAWAVIRTLIWPISLPIIASFALGNKLAVRQIAQAHQQKQIDALANDVIARRL